MAQTGFTPIQLYFSSTTTNVPLAANLANGELAINITDGKLFYKDNASAVQVIGWKVTPTSAGGTGLTSYTAGDMVYYASGTALSKLGIGTTDYVMTSSGSAPQWSASLKAIAGGTGQTSYAVGDLLYANTTTTLAKLADVATGNALISGGVGVAPSWGKIGLTTHVSGVLPVANGGTNASTAGIASFNNITGYSASGATGTTSTNLVFSTSPSITTPTLVSDVTLSTGNLVFGTSSTGLTSTGTITCKSSSSGANWQVFSQASSTNPAYFILGAGTVNGIATGANGAASAMYVNKDSGSTRSINAAGTVNAAGLDYAEYMIKSGDFTVNKGDVVGIDAQGKLTNVFADAVSFVVKSTSPSYVGGDSWFNEQAPEDTSLLASWKQRLEAARLTVDRIAFCGQVPVNVIGATAGQYIIPVNNNGAIKGEAVSNPTFEQYQTAVGKIIAIESDGRAKIIVKIA